MATINIGSLSLSSHKGDYDNSTSYVKNDVVYYATTGSAYIAKQATTGNLPTSTAHWNVFAAGSGGIWNAGLSLGTAGQIVHVNSGASALEFTDAPAGGVVQTKFYNYDGTLAATNTSFADLGSFSLTITPTSASNKILLMVSFGSATGSGNNTTALRFTRDGTAIGIGEANGNRPRASFRVIGSSYSSDNHAYPAMHYYVDSPSSTSAITYKVQNRNESGTFRVNRANAFNNANTTYDGGFHSTFIAQEIVA